MQINIMVTTILPPPELLSLGKIIVDKAIESECVWSYEDIMKKTIPLDDGDRAVFCLN